MFPGYPEHCNVEGTLSQYSRNIACRLDNACLHCNLPWRSTRQFVLEPSLVRFVFLANISGRMHLYLHSYYKEFPQTNYHFVIEVAFGCLMFVYFLFFFQYLLQRLSICLIWQIVPGKKIQLFSLKNFFTEIQVALITDTEIQLKMPKLNHHIESKYRFTFIISLMVKP